jgi:glycosyltransferase involved in cell wall biosynthesis
LFLHGAIDTLHIADRLAARTEPDLVIANSRFTAETVARLYSAVPTAVVYPPVPPAPSYRVSAAAERRAIRSEFGVGADVGVIIQISRMEKLKGHELHLRALSMLGPGTRWECWQVGGPQTATEQHYFAGLRGLATELGLSQRVRWLGERTDVRRLLGAADIYCQPNLTPDAFGITFVEALYAGLPVVTTAMGGAMEIVNESCGILAKPGDPAALAGALGQLLGNPARRARLAAAAPARAAAISDPATQLRRLGRTLERVVAGLPVDEEAAPC